MEKEFVDNVKVLVNALGYKVLDAYTNAIQKKSRLVKRRKKI